MVLALNVSADPYQRTRTRDTRRGKKGSAYTDYRTPSKPGEPPHKRTAALQGGVQYELDKPKLTGRVGVVANVRYGLFLELGTRKMAARPFLLATLRKVWSQLQALAGGR